jgi:hypothetical protein
MYRKSNVVTNQYRGLNEPTKPDARLSSGLVFNLRRSMPFGKYRGYSMKSIIDQDPGYVYWAMENIGGFSLASDAHDYYQDKILSKLELHENKDI